MCLLYGIQLHGSKIPIPVSDYLRHTELEKLITGQSFDINNPKSNSPFSGFNLEDTLADVFPTLFNHLSLNLIF